MHPTGGVLRLGRPGSRRLLFVPGFLGAPAGYRSLLAPLAVAGLEVVVVGLYRRGPRALLGHPSPAEEAVLLESLCRRTRDEGRELWLAGHSRGGQVAWRAAGAVPPDGLALVDPVDGAGPRTRPNASRTAPHGLRRTLVVGAARGGRCAPKRLGHRAFSAADPRAWHAVVDDCGHADVLDGWERALGRRLCGGGHDPDAARTTVTALLRAYLDDALPADPAATDFQPDGATVPVAWV